MNKKKEWMGLYFSVHRDLRLDFRRRYLDAASNLMLNIAFGYHNDKKRIHDVFFMAAFYHGYDKVIEHLSIMYGMNITYKHIEELARGGHLELLKVFIPSFGKYVPRFVTKAASADHMHIVTYLIQKYNNAFEHLNARVLNGASVLPLQRYIEIRAQYPTHIKFEFAYLAKRNRMDIITTLQLRPVETCFSAIYFHRVEDRIPLLQYCRKHVRFSTTDDVLACCASADQILWARQNCDILPSRRDPLSMALRFNSVAVCRLYFTNQRIKSDLEDVVRMKGPFWQEKKEWLEKL